MRSAFLKINKKQLVVLWVCITLFLPLFFTLHTRISDYKKISIYLNYLNSEHEFLMTVAAKRPVDLGKSLDDQMKLRAKKEEARRKIIRSFLNIFCMISFTSLFLFCFKSPPRASSAN